MHKRSEKGFEKIWYKNIIGFESSHNAVGENILNDCERLRYIPYFFNTYQTKNNCLRTQADLINKKREII